MMMENYYKANKNNLKSILSKNLKTNNKNIHVISKDDEWINETEWDELYNKLKSEQ